MTLTKQHLMAKGQALRQDHQRLLADTLRFEGALQLLEVLLAELEKPEPAPVPASTNEATKMFVVPPPPAVEGEA